jgi:Fe-S cluster biosynthesis and repair protein YggX
MRAAAELTRLGYTNVIDLRGGFEGEKDDGGAVLVQGWRDSGLPVEAGDPPGRAYVELYAAVSIPPPPAPKVESGGHSHAGHGHSHAASAGPAVAGIKLNRFASATRKIHCSKLGAELPALKRKPMGGPLGERIFAEISADAWDQWVEHSKLLINEYRMNPSDPKAQELLIKQCEEFLFGAKAEVPKEFVAPKS